MTFDDTLHAATMHCKLSNYCYFAQINIYIYIDVGPRSEVTQNKNQDWTIGLVSPHRPEKKTQIGMAVAWWSKICSPGFLRVNIPYIYRNPA